MLVCLSKRLNRSSAQILCCIQSKVVSKTFPFFRNFKLREKIIENPQTFLFVLFYIEQTEDAHRESDNKKLKAP